MSDEKWTAAGKSPVELVEQLGRNLSHQRSHRTLIRELQDEQEEILEALTPRLEVPTVVDLMVLTGGWAHLRLCRDLGGEVDFELFPLERPESVKWVEAPPEPEPEPSEGGEVIDPSFVETEETVEVLLSPTDMAEADITEPTPMEPTASQLRRAMFERFRARDIEETESA